MRKFTHFLKIGRSGLGLVSILNAVHKKFQFHRRSSISTGQGYSKFTAEGWLTPTG